MIVVHPGIPGGRSCNETTCHLDIVPTVVAMTGKSAAPVAATMERMMGKDLTPLLEQPVDPAFTISRGGVLFCYSQLMVHDPNFTRELYTTLFDKSIARSARFQTIESFPVDWSVRGSIRTIMDERYKFSRYFSFRQFNAPATLEQLTSMNDLELYDLREDPEEMKNLAYDFAKNKDLIAMMNAKLNALIAREIGIDDGGFLPLKNWINWDKAAPHSINI